MNEYIVILEKEHKTEAIRKIRKVATIISTLPGRTRLLVATTEPDKIKEIEGVISVGNNT